MLGGRGEPRGGKHAGTYPRKTRQEVSCESTPKANQLLFDIQTTSSTVSGREGERTHHVVFRVIMGRGRKFSRSRKTSVHFSNFVIRRL